MGCRCAKRTDEYHGWECSITEGECMFLIPNEKSCYEKYEEGPLSDDYGHCCETCAHAEFSETDGYYCNNKESGMHGDYYPADEVCCGWEGKEEDNERCFSQQKSID